MPMFPLQPKPWYRALADIYSYAASVLDPDEYARAVLLRETWRERMGPLDWANETDMARLRFHRWLIEQGRMSDGV